eukprot:jgi/Picre1/32236/NNA_007582.t1
MEGTIHSRLDRFYASSDMTRYITQPIKTIEIHSYGIVSDHKPVIMSIIGKLPHKDAAPVQKEYMKRIKTAAKCHPLAMKEARYAFEAFLSSFQDGIWLSEETQGSLPETDRHRMILEQYPHIKRQLGKIWNQASNQAIAALKLALHQAAEQGIDRHIKDCKRQLQQGQQANRSDSHTCIPNDAMDQLSYQLLMRPKGSNCIGSLTDPKSQYTYTRPKGIANCLINTIAEVSKPPQTNQEAQQELIDLITEEDRTVFPTFCDPSETISPQEVAKALRKIRNSCPGDDGLQIIHYRKFSKWMCLSWPHYSQPFLQGTKCQQNSIMARSEPLKKEEP